MEKENLSEEQKLANKIYEIPFVSCNLDMLSKKELITLIESIIATVSDKKEEWNGLYLKDLLYAQKCWLIECLDRDFFKKE